MINLTELLQTKEPLVGNTIFISVDGHGGSGKSTLGKWLGEQLKAEVIQTDDFAGWDNPLDWWPIVVKKVFGPIANGAQSLSYDRASWWENHHPEPVVDQPVTPIMILEGVSSGRSEFDQYISLRIFVDTPKDICLARGITRDSATGKSEVELKQMWEEWLQEEEAYFTRDNPKEKADVLIYGTKPFEEQLTI